MKTAINMKRTIIAAASALMLLAGSNAYAQLGNALNRTRQSVQKTTVNKTGQQNATNKTTANNAATPQTGNILYVSASTGAGSRTADGSKEKPYKDLQAAIDAAPEGALIRIAEGNYLGKMDQGFIEVKKYISLEAGWNTDFTERNYVKYLTSVRPTEEVAKAGTSGSHALMDVVVKGNRKGTVSIDGIFFDMGQYNLYVGPLYDNPVASAPAGCETGRIILPDESPSGVSTVGGVKGSRQCLYGAVEGRLVVRNCVFANAMHYGIQMENIAGHWEISNNMFVACRMAGCEVRGNGVAPETETTLDFHHNTVVFTWTRTKLLEDMGYGFRYMTRMNYDVHDNLFGGNYYGALDRTRFDSDLKRDKLRETNAYDNLFFANRMGDVCLPSGGGLWNWQYAKNFEEVEQFKKYEGNREVNESEIKMLQKAISDPYLKGYIGLTMSQNSSYAENSAMNTFRAAMGMNKQGTETVRVSMYGNRYPFEEITKLWGVIAGKGAQMP
ncbi:MAG TPA: hypothetical protein DEQ30_00645 [Porphyromonadaceae bacterium]|nr:hypothetical protein [Porphyromonadaceae bacterium]